MTRDIPLAYKTVEDLKDRLKVDAKKYFERNRHPSPHMNGLFELTYENIEKREVGVIPNYDGKHDLSLEDDIDWRAGLQKIGDHYGVKLITFPNLYKKD